MTNKNEPFGTPDADGWYEWKGDGMVRPAGRVEYLCRSGEVGTDGASGLRWAHDGSNGDIVKWRPAR